jgi:esterase/lipase superfamily enzyme
VSYASITVSIPADSARKIGEVQWPTSLPGNPRNSFITVAANDLDRASFAAALSVAAKQTGPGRVLVFVHGFNNRFDEAVFRFSQIVHDSKAPAVPVLFSWPSRGVVGLNEYKRDLEDANNSRQALQQLLDTIAANANVREVTVVCHSMGCSPTLEALRSKAIDGGKIGVKIKNVLLVAPDVDVNVFRTQMRQMGSARPRFALFVSQDDHALKLSKTVLDGATRLGDIDTDQEPYKSDFKREGILVFDLTGLRGGAHSRAFENVTSVVGLIEQRFAQGQSIAEDGSTSASGSQ